MYCIINNNKQAQSKAVIESLHFADSGEKAPLSELRRVYIIWATREGNALAVIKAPHPSPLGVAALAAAFDGLATGSVTQLSKTLPSPEGWSLVTEFWIPVEEEKQIPFSP